MGGHGHHEPYKVPDYKIYQVKGIPELETTQRALAAQGLKDPWLRNEVWRYEKKNWGSRNARIRAFFFTGFRTGVIAVAITLAGTALYDRMYPPKHGHDHH